MISKISTNSFSPAFGYVTKTAAAHAKRLAGKNSEKLAEVEKLIKTSGKNAPSVQIKYNKEKGFYYVLPDNNELKCFMDGLNAFKNTCNEALADQKTITSNNWWNRKKH